MENLKNLTENQIKNLQDLAMQSMRLAHQQDNAEARDNCLDALIRYRDELESRLPIFKVKGL